METQPNETDTRVLLRYITSCTDSSNSVPAMLVLQQAIDLLDKYPTDKTPILSAWDYIHKAQDALSLATHMNFWRQTPGYQVAATMYILLQIDGLKKPSDEALANDIVRVLETRNNFHFDLDEVNHTIEQMKQCKKAAPPFINPMDICMEIANGKNLAEIDWKVLLNEIVKYKQIFDRTYPYYLLLHGFMHIIPAAMRRVDVIGHLQDAAPSCLKTSDAQQFIKEADWLVWVYTRLHHLLLDNPMPDVWKNEPFMNEMALYIVHMEPEEVVAISQSIYESYDLYNKRIGIVPHILRHKQFAGRLLTTDCVDFCRGLYLAYGFSMLLQSGTEDYRVLPSIDNLDIELRNKCFDVFIKLRIEQLMKQMKSNNRRLYPPTIDEAYSELVKELSERQKNLEQFGDHYHKMAYDSLHCATSFLVQYTKDRQKEQEEQRAQSVAKSVAPMQILAQQVIIENNHAPITSIEKSDVTINQQ